MTKKRPEDEERGLARRGDRFSHVTNIAALAAGLAGDNANSIVAQTPGGIERQEAAAQKTFAATDRLPVRGLSEKTKLRLARIGFVFGARLTGADRIFIACRLPANWRKQPTAHAMWTDLLDPAGRVRASIFFKGAFYDYDAHISFTRRYGITALYCDAAGNEVGARDSTHKQYRIVDRGFPEGDARHVIEVGDVLPDPDWVNDRPTAQARDQMQSFAQQALRERLAVLFPDHDDEMAYWEDVEVEQPAVTSAAFPGVRIFMQGEHRLLGGLIDGQSETMTAELLHPGVEMERGEHLAWAKSNALRQLDATPEYPELALEMMLRCTLAHPELAAHAGNDLMVLLYGGGHLRDVRDVRRHIEGYN